MLRPDKIASYFKSEKRVLAAVTASGIIYNAGLLSGPYFQGKLIDAIAARSALAAVLPVAALLVGSALAVQGARAVKRFYVRRFANDVNKKMQNIVYAHLVREPEDRLLNQNVGALMTKAVSDVDACVEGMRKFTTELFDTGVFIISYLITLFIYDWKLTLASCAFIPAALFAAGMMRKIITGYTAAWRKTTGEVAYRTYDMTNNAMLYRIFGREEDNCTSYDALNKKCEKKAVLATVWENSMMPVYRIISLAGIVVIVAAGAGKVAADAWTIGRFTAYAAMFIALAEKASHAGKLFNAVQKAEVSWQRIKPFMEMPAAETKGQPAGAKEEASAGTCCAAVEFSGAGFSWNGSSPVFSGLSLSLPRGSMLGVTGPVACGKSTFARIFLGGLQYDGSVKLCGRELSSIPERERTKLVSYMGHDASLMTGTIYDNITLGDDGNIHDVLHTVCFEEDLASMKDGMQTLVGNGGMRLSGGQQERIALARALYHKAPLIVLDDPFAAVDRNTERTIFSRMRISCRDCAVILISHRLSVFAELDSVLVFEGNGAYAHAGHEELLASSETYRTLYALQEAPGTEEHKA